jgi:hypothetical protein
VIEVGKVLGYVSVMWRKLVTYDRVAAQMSHFDGL